MPENNKQNKPVRSEKFTEARDDNVPQPKGKFVNPFKSIQERNAESRRKEVEAARPRQQDQTSE